jgi:hypothetical protein
MGLVIFPMVKVRRLSRRKQWNLPLHYSRAITRYKNNLLAGEWYTIISLRYEEYCTRSLAVVNLSKVLKLRGSPVS